MRSVPFWVISGAFIVAALFFLNAPSDIPAKEELLNTSLRQAPEDIVFVPVVEVVGTQIVNQAVDVTNSQRFLGFSLTGIFMDPASPKRSFAIIEWPDSQSVNVKIGDMLKEDVFLTEITARYVVLKYKNESYQLRLTIEPPPKTSYAERLSSSNTNYTPTSDRAVRAMFPSTNSPIINRINQPQDAKLTKKTSQYSSNDETKIERQPKPSSAINVVGAWQRKSVADSDGDGTILIGNGSKADNRESDETAPEQTLKDEEIFTSELPQFMNANTTDAYVPFFMQGGELDIYVEQIPEYMRQ